MIKDFFLEYYILARKKMRKTFAISLILLLLILLFTALAIGFELSKMDAVTFRDITTFLSDEETIFLLCLFSISPLILLISSSIFLVSKKDYSKWTLTKLAVDNPQDVVWVYRGDTNIKLSGASIGKYSGFSIGNRWGRIYKIVKVDEEKLEQILRECPSYFPKATIGWSEKLEAQYKADPSSLAVR